MPKFCWTDAVRLYSCALASPTSRRQTLLPLGLCSKRFKSDSYVFPDVSTNDPFEKPFTEDESKRSTICPETSYLV